jgi:hypothetical protein
MAFLNSISQMQEPTDYHEAIKIPVWCKVMREELDVLENNKIWVIM